jgi:hypothetical protein
MAGAISGIGGFRSPGNPDDPRYGYGEVPQEATIVGLPNGSVALRLDYAGIPGNSPSARGADGRRGKPYASRLRQEQLDPKPRGVDVDPRTRRGGLSDLLLGESDVAYLTDKAMRGQPRVALRAEDVMTRERGQENPSIAIEYGDYAYGMPRQSNYEDVTLTDNDRFGAFTSDDPTERRPKAEFGTNIAPYGTVDVPDRQVSGQWAVSSGPRQGQLAVKRIDPTATAYTRPGNLDSPYSSEQADEVSIGRAAKEAKEATEPPVIGSSALSRKGFIPAEKLPADVLNIYAKGGELGTFVGMAETARSEQYPRALGSLATRKAYVPVYRAERWNPELKAMEQMTAKREVPAGRYGVEVVEEPLFRLGQPSSYDMAAIAEELGPLLGVQSVRTAAPGSRKAIGFPEVRAIAEQQGYEVYADPRREVAIRPEQIDGTFPVYFRKSDGSNSQLTPKLDEAGRPTGAFHLTGNYGIEREVGPGPLSTDAGIRRWVGNEDTYIDNSRRQLGRLGEGAISTERFLNELIAGSFMDAPETRNAYRDVIAPLVASGELSLDDPRLVGTSGQPLFAPGSQSRALVEQALVEMGQRKIDLNRPVIGTQPPLSEEEIERAREIQVMASEPEFRRLAEETAAQEMAAIVDAAADIPDEAAFGDDDAAYSGGVRRDRSGFGIARDPNPTVDSAYAAAKQRAYEMLQSRLDDTDARLAAYQGNTAQAEILAEIAMRQGGNLDAELGKLLGGEVRGSFDRRIGKAVTGEQAEMARAIRAKYQGGAPGLPYDRELADAGIPQMSYSQMATELNSANPEKQERAMQIMQNVIKARQGQAAASATAAARPIVAAVNTESQSMLNAPAPLTSRAVGNYGPVEEVDLMNDVDIARQYAPAGLREQVVSGITESIREPGVLSPQKQAAMEFVGRMRRKFNL